MKGMARGPKVDPNRTYENIARSARNGPDLVDLLRLGAAVSCGFFNVLIVHPANPAKTVADVLAQARAKPGELTHSSGGIGTSHHMSGVLLELRTGVKLQHVPRFGRLERSLVHPSKR